MISRRHVMAVAAVIGTLLPPTSLVRADDLEEGKAQFVKSCGVCHTVEKDAPPRQGPNLRGVFGRPAGALAGFKYSDAVKGWGVPWDEAGLDAWITDPKAVRPGTIMVYRQTDPEKRKKVIDYLKAVTD